MDRHEERDMDMAGKMSGIDMHGASGHEDARDLRNATGAAPVGVNSKSGELPEHVPLSGHGRVERSSDRMQPARSPEPKWWQSFRAGHGARVRRLAASLVVAIAASVFGAPALAQTTCNAPDLAGRTQIWTNTVNVGSSTSGNVSLHGWYLSLVPPLGSLSNPANRAFGTN